jgi:GNAT superfamily N-acetyltransferase
VTENPLAERITVRDARRDDVPAIVALYRTDEFTRKHHGARDSGVEPGYYAVFEAIDFDPRNRLLVAEHEAVVAGSFQLTLVPDMSPNGLEIAIIENVIVDVSLRGRGIGSAMMGWAIDEARRHNCRRVTLTSLNARADAHRFYARLGFEPTHVGMKLTL